MHKVQARGVKCEAKGVIDEAARVQGPSGKVSIP